MAKKIKCAVNDEDSVHAFNDGRDINIEIVDSFGHSLNGQTTSQVALTPKKARKLAKQLRHLANELEKRNV